MYQYYRLIRTKYNQEVTSIVIYTGKQKPQVYDYYKEQSYGTSVIYRFKTYRIIKQEVESLLQNPNPYAIIVLANYYVLKTTARQKERLTFKEQVYELAKNRGYSETKTANLLLFITELMRLTPIFDSEFKNHISKSSNSTTDMFKYSQSTIDVVNAQTLNLFGTTVEEALAKVENERAKVENERAKVESAEAKAREILTSVIVRCYKKLNMSIDEIADLVSKEPKEVYLILIEEKIIQE
jgi:hypothetical protein